VELPGVRELRDHKQAGWEVSFVLFTAQRLKWWQTWTVVWIINLVAQGLEF